jgi:twitching motility protein PilT
MEGAGSALRELDFTDLYVCLSSPEEISTYTPRQKPGSRPRNAVVPPQFAEAIDSLVKVIQKDHKATNFSMDYDSMRMRGVHFRTTGGQEWVCLRRFPPEVPDLDNLGFSPDVLHAFKSWGKRSGLIVVGGSTRAGKTTTATALLKYYLQMHGQVAITIEDPIEYDMQGRHGEDGMCFQIPVHEEDHWADRMKDALRSGPRFILLGEVRTPAAARNLLRAANSGHLVITTVHGGRVEETLSSIVQIARNELGDMAMSLLADGLVAVVHQRLENGRPINQILATRDDSSDPIRVIIRAGKLQTLSSEIARQGISRRNEVNSMEKEVVKVTPKGVVRPAAQTATTVTAAPKKRWGLFGG